MEQDDIKTLETQEHPEKVQDDLTISESLDESPMAYKDCDEIMRLIEPTAEILFLVKPKINIKAFDSCE